MLSLSGPLLSLFLFLSRRRYVFLYLKFLSVASANTDTGRSATPANTNMTRSIGIFLSKQVGQ